MSFEVEIKFPKVRLDASIISIEADRLADDLTRLLVAENQLSLLHYGKKVSADTLRSVQGNPIVKSATFQHRQVIAAAGYKFIRDGRRKGAKMPVYFAGTGVRGGKIFEPFPEMLKWFFILGIPRSAWFPIMRSISRKGIKPTPVDVRAIRQARPAINRYVKQTAARIVRGLVKVGK